MPNIKPVDIDKVDTKTGVTLASVKRKLGIDIENGFEPDYLEEPGFDDVKRFVMPTFAEKGLDISEHVIDNKLEEFIDIAKVQIMETNDNA